MGTQADFEYQATWYEFFEGYDDYPFDPSATDISMPNAWFFSECAMLAYEKNDKRISDVMARAGFPHVDCFSAASTEGYVAQNDDIAIVAFRGTERDDIRDILTDLDFRKRSEGAGRIHRGFHTAMAAIWSMLYQELSSLKLNKQLYWTGHSLGAALAAIGASRLGGDGLYLFGSPRIGNRDFRNSLNGKMPTYHFVHNVDIVCQLPPALLGYVHVGNQELIAASGWIHRHNALFERVKLLNYLATRSIGIIAAPLWLILLSNHYLIGGYRDHDPIWYCEKLKAKRHVEQLI